jgi:hypothetical protein
MKKLILLFALCVLCGSANAQQSTPDSDEGTPTAAGPRYVRLPLKSESATIAKPVSAQVSGYTWPNAATRRKRFINSVIGPWALGRQVATAGISTWRNSPEEWGDKWEGFGRRVASNFGRNVIKQTAKFGIDEALKTDSHFYRSKNKSVSARVVNALISPVTARDKNGKRVIGIANLTGTYAASIISRETWYPDRYDWKDGVKSGTISLGFNAAFNLFKEFVWKK